MPDVFDQLDSLSEEDGLTKVYRAMSEIRRTIRQLNKEVPVLSEAAVRRRIAAHRLEMLLAFCAGAACALGVHWLV